MYIQVPYKYSKDKVDAYNKAKDIITSDYFSQWDIEVDIDCVDEFPRITAQGKGFRLEINFEDTICEAYVELAFMLKPFKGKIEKVISKELSSKL